MDNNNMYVNNSQFEWNGGIPCPTLNLNHHRSQMEEIEKAMEMMFQEN